jgi:dipeptidyl aminopeptidase/acylaminoacyl peptidase
MPSRAVLAAAFLVTLAPPLAPPLAAQDSADRGGAIGSPRAERRALALEDYYRMRNVGSPRLSPDGEWVTYTVSTPIEETNGNAREAWLVRAAGSAPPVRITHDGEDVTDPGWHDDGRLRYTHRGATWLAHPARLDAARERDAAASPSGVRSPDGRWIARLRDVPGPERAAPRRSAFEQRHVERFAGHEFDWYPFLRDGQSMPIPNPREASAAELFVEPASGGDARQLTRLGLRPSGMQWAPDGSALLFSANAAWRDELRYGTPDLFLVRLDGSLTRLTDDGYSYGGASFSPDGGRIAYTRSWGTDMIVDGALEHGGPTDLFVQRLDGGAPLNLTADWDLDAGSPIWAPDGRHIYFTAGIGGATHLFRVPAGGGRVEQVTSGERRIQSLDIDRTFRRMTYTVGELDRPADVWVADIDGRNERRLTDEHRAFLGDVEVATRPSETIRWQSYDGTTIEGFLIFPHGYEPDSGPYPLIVMNHGGPHSASGYGFSFKNHFFAANGYFVLLPNFRASTGYGQAFKWGTWGAWGEKDGEDVLSGVDHLIEHFPVDRQRVGSTGHSYGGIITNWLITRYPDRFAAAVSGAGESNWTSNFALSDIARTKETEFFGRPWEPRAREIMIRQSPYLNCGGARTPTLFVHGEVDYRVPLSGALQLYTCLKKQGVPAKVLIYEGQAHSISGHWNNVHRMMSELEWWTRYLQPVT